jgi:ATP-binding cassette, subfamily B, multidrug efflux pump
MELNTLLKSPLTAYMRRYPRPFFLGLFFLVITNLLDASHPLIIREALDSLASQAPPEEILKWGLLFLAVLSCLATTRYLWRVYFGTYHTQAAEDLRQKLFQHLLYLDPSYYQKQPSGELVSLLIHDIQAYRQAIGQAVLITIDGLLISFFILPMMWWLQPSWLAKTLIFIPLLPFIMRFIMTQINHHFKTQQENLAELSQFAQESLTGIRVIKSFSQEKSRAFSFKKYNRAFLKSSEKLALVDSAFGPLMELSVAFGSTILIFLAAPDLLSGAVSVGTFVAFQRYINKMAWPMTALGIGLSQYQKGMTSFERIKKVLLQKSSIESGSQVLKDIESLELDQVTFDFPENSHSILKNISLRITQGNKVGLLGPIGSGKSILCQLLVRLYNPSSGSFKINGILAKEFSLESLRSQILLVTQEPLLFSMTIRENMALTKRQLSDEDIWQALRLSEIEEEIRNLPHQLDSLVGEKGVNFSGGQKQRLALARALLFQPSFLILDDPLSAVDIHTEEKIVTNLSTLSCSLLLISHRLNVLKNCPHLIVLNQNHIEAQGHFCDLEKSSPTYQKLSSLQGTS